MLFKILKNDNVKINCCTKTCRRIYFTPIKMWPSPSKFSSWHAPQSLTQCTVVMHLTLSSFVHVCLTLNLRIITVKRLWPSTVQQFEYNIRVYVMFCRRRYDADFHHIRSPSWMKNLWRVNGIRYDVSMKYMFVYLSKHNKIRIGNMCINIYKYYPINQILSTKFLFLRNDKF